MKRQYVKPDLSFESFEMSSNIAASCGTSAGYSVQDCQDKIAPGLPGTLFDGSLGCTILPDEAGICYQKAGDDQKIFAS